jgi:Pycsar effector protein
MSQQPQDVGDDSSALPEPVPAALGEPEKKKEKRDKKQSRGVETMFRVTYQNHVALSRLADNKAHMLISINGLIVSGVVAFLRSRLGTLSWDIVPVFVLILGCMVSLAFAVVGARPRVTRTGVTLDGVRNNTENVLFFGQFTRLSLPEFQEALRVLMKDPALLYDNLGRQLYLMGQSLNRKYHYLQIAYFAFLAATGLATALYVIGYLMLGFGV